MKFIKTFLELARSKAAVYVILGALFISIIILACFARYILSALPPVYEMEEYTPSLSTKVYDVNEKLIHEFSIEKRSMVPLEEIPVDIQNGVIAMEDRAFFEHPGFSIKGTLRAVIYDLFTARAKQGGSTLTQQLSRGVFLSKEKKIIRKIREIILAVQIENRFSKYEILQLYLNEIYFGRGAYGIKAAAKKYFNKELQDLSLAESALLVGVIPAPERYNPFSSPDRALERRRLVLKVMQEQGFITEEEAALAMEEPLPEKAPEEKDKPGQYFIEHIRRYLEPKYGMDVLWKAGLSIYTTIDIEKQTAAEELMEKKLHEYDLKIAKGLGIDIPEFSDENVETTEDGEPVEPTEPDLTNYPRLQGSFIVRDVKTGAVRVLIGGRDYSESRFNRATQSKRQPGSSFKPFVWMAALQKNYTPATLVKDLPTLFYFDGKNWRTFDEEEDQYSLSLAGQSFISSKSFSVWVPQNMGGRSSGWVTLRSALEKSKNLVAVNLIDAIGIGNVISVARKAGIKSNLAPVPALALGVSAVTLEELLSAMSTFGNNGIHTENYFIEKVVDANGRVLEQHIPYEQGAFSQQDSYLLINMMKGVTDRGTAGAARTLKRPLAAKTGTSQNHRDTWFVGMTPQTAAAAWMGYDDDTSQKDGRWTGGGSVGPWWTDIMEVILKDEEPLDFPVPEGISFVYINPVTGKLAQPTDRTKFLEAFKKGTEPKSF
ncbi:Putative peptidoglycan glycosyltransferase [Elusimicrobium minutum Pei191]|uniref:peptidoglycan glycosyltransferase n=1 Tax=Elusimicrobium minutum (strain Pei191) TaxID=445932 RepID=B2KBP1_ELUMP|nr:transglycosylase domain-containing protein [Elusimicrobium minutum]ACC97728.1 Putative peptidoglycan glycosyltransferase [Elusimicrobium minutum Pei191]